MGSSGGRSRSAREALAEKVAAFRRGLDVERCGADCNGWSARRRRRTSADCRASSAVGLSRRSARRREKARAWRAPSARRPSATRAVRSWSRARALRHAHRPGRGADQDKRHLIVVPSGALTALPFHLLVTEKPAVAVPQVEDAARPRGLSRRGLAAQAPCRERAAFGREPQGAARVRAQGTRRRAR